MRTNAGSSKAVGPDVYLQKEVETVMPVLEKLPGVGSLYCFVTQTNEKVTP